MAHPELVFCEARALVDDKVETPWSPPRAANKLKANDPADNQLRLPVEILDRLFRPIPTG